MDNTSQFLSHKLCGKHLIIKSLNFENNDIVSKLENVGIFKNQKIYVKDMKINKNIIHIIVNDLEYALRIKDASRIEVIVDDMSHYNKK